MSENILKYRGYRAAIEFDADDGILAGRVLGVRHIIDFHGTDADSVRDAFKAAIDGYLDSCREAGIEPCKPRPDKITLPLPLDVAAALERIGERTGQSPRELILDAVKNVYLPVAAKTEPGKRTNRAGKRLAVQR